MRKASSAIATLTAMATVLLLTNGARAVSTNDSPPPPIRRPPPPPPPVERELVLAIDVDNTLYSEAELVATSAAGAVGGGGIESQIIRNTHLFCRLHCDLSPDECDDLYRAHGSTVEGLRLNPPPSRVSTTAGGAAVVDGETLLAKFYEEVYDPIDIAGRLNPIHDAAGASSSSDATGYDHGGGGAASAATVRRRRAALSTFLTSICNTRAVYLASNSPRRHVTRAIGALGLRGAGFAGLLTPDLLPDGGSGGGGEPSPPLPFPTKASPEEYYRSLLDRYPPRTHRIVLLDDSAFNLHAAERVGIGGVLVGHDGGSGIDDGGGRTLEEGLAEALGHIPPPAEYAFSDARYLRAKNEVDARAVDPAVWDKLAEELADRLRTRRIGECAEGDESNGGYELRIADLGAGLLSFLELMMNGGGGGTEEDEAGHGHRRKDGLFGKIDGLLASNGDGGKIKSVRYYAYESNANLLDGCRERLARLGFTEEKATTEEGGGTAAPREAVFRRSADDNTATPDVEVRLRQTDFRSESDPPPGLDVVVGCCFADLFDPDDLADSLVRFARGRPSNTSAGGPRPPPPLAYFPITFAGATRFSPARPFEDASSSGRAGSESRRRIPSDDLVFRLYADSLARRGHCTDPSRIVRAVRDRGGSLVAEGTSPWRIDPQANGYLWETMMYFFGTSGGREMEEHPSLDAAGWVERARRDRRNIVVSNTDLLFRLAGDEGDAAKYDGGQNDGSANDATSADEVEVEEIQFIAPRRVTSSRKTWNTRNGRHLGPDQVEIASVCSLISSGTELKIFNGSFDTESKLDVNIDGMADESMTYPLAYGYSLVGRVVACGSNVKDADDLMDRLVFAFSPHSSRVVADRAGVKLVPEGIAAEDAIFLPSVETALSIVHDAHVRFGENVAVFGQGLIGLLVTAVLSLQTPASPAFLGRHCSITAVDALEDRLRTAAALGATAALDPKAASHAGPFDVSIEASGNPRALQSAIDRTSDGGRIVVASWYGRSDVTLKLGIEFHRSHKTITTSQVSTIPAALTGLWDKERRFALAWALVEAIRPSKLISKSLSLNEAQLAYELLDGGKEIAVSFEYNKKR